MSVNMGQAVGYLDLDTTKFTGGFAKAKATMTGFFSQATTMSGRLKMISNGLASVGSTMTKTVTLPIVGLGTAIVKTGADFEKAMSQVQATMGASKEDMGDLEAVAKKMGAETKFSATEAAEGLNYLALAGYTTEQQIAALPKVLSLASAGDMDLALASDMLTDSMSALGLASKDSNVLMSNMNIMVDQMAKTASKSNTSVSQLGEAILAVGGTAKNLKGGTTELNTVLGILADNGTKASEAGIHLRNIILAMNPTTDAAAGAFKELGVKTYDASGELRAMDDIFLDLAKAMEGMTDQRKTQLLTAIFNKTDLKDVNALLDTNVERWNELSDAIENSGGAADKMASDQLDNLDGQLTILKSGVEGVALSFNDVFVKYVKSAVEKVQQLVDYLNSLNDTQKETIVRIAGIAAAIGPVMLIVSKLISSVLLIGSTFGKAFNIITLGFTRVKEAIMLAKAGYTALAAEALPVMKILSATGPIAGLIAAIVALVAAWKTNFGHIREYTEQIFGSIKEIFSGLQDVVRSIINNIKNMWETNFLGIQDIVDGVLSNVEILFEAFLSVIASIFDGINKLVHGDFKGAMDAFAKIPQTVLKAFKQVFTNLLDFLVDVFSNLIDKAKDSMSKFVTNMKEGATEAAKKFMQFLKDLPYNLGVLLGKAIAKAILFARDFRAKAYEAGKNFLDSLINFIKELPGKTWTWLKSVIDKAGNFAKTFPKKAKEAAKEFGDSLVKKLKELPGKVVEIGVNIATGIGKGIKNGISSALNAVTDFGKGIMDGFKSVFDIHSPSKKAEKQIGEQFANGVIKGIKNKRGEAKKSSSEMAQDILDAATKKLDALKTYNKITAGQEVEYWKTVMNNMKEGTDGYLEAYKKYQEARANVNAEILRNAEEYYERYTTYNEMNLRQEMEYWDTVRKQIQKGTDERLEADKKYLSAKENYYNAIDALDKQYIEDQTAIYKKLNEDIEALTKSYNDAVEGRTNALLGTFKLFDEYTTRTETTGATLLANLQSQVDALKDWDAELAKLEERELLPPELVDEIRDMGVDARGEITALNTMTDEQLKQYVSLWEEKNRLARERAIRELAPLKEETSKQIIALQKQSQKDLKDLTKVYNKELEALGAEGKKSANAAGTSIMAGLQAGIKNKKKDVSSELDDILSMVKSKLDSINSMVASAKRAASEMPSVGSGVGLGAIVGGALGGLKGFHANGLDYVPYNGYVASLHKGERVLTQEENEAYEGGRRGSGDVYNFYGTPPLDEKETARQFKQVQQDLALGF